MNIMETLRYYSCAILLAVIVLAAGPVAAQMTNWTVRASDGPATEVAGETVKLEQPKDGSCTALGPRIPVTPGTALALQFRYTAENLTRSVVWYDGANAVVSELTVTVHWYDSTGRDVDESLALQGFPPSKRVWVLTRSSVAPIEVADTIMVPAQGVVATSVAFAQVRLTLRLAGPGKPVTAQISGMTLTPGEVIPKGLDIPESGPADAGALSAQPDGFKFGANLVQNGALEDGEAAPTG